MKVYMIVTKDPRGFTNLSTMIFSTRELAEQYIQHLLEEHNRHYSKYKCMGYPWIPKEVREINVIED